MDMKISHFKKNYDYVCHKYKTTMSTLVKNKKLKHNLNHIRKTWIFWHDRKFSNGIWLVIWNTWNMQIDKWGYFAMS
jgi:hypothetical protein